jgi:hypothetical protein
MQLKLSTSTVPIERCLRNSLDSVILKRDSSVVILLKDYLRSQYCAELKRVKLIRFTEKWLTY